MGRPAEKPARLLTCVRCTHDFVGTARQRTAGAATDGPLKWGKCGFTLPCLVHQRLRSLKDLTLPDDASGKLLDELERLLLYPGVSDLLVQESGRDVVPGRV
ncbi:hypothetical protein Ato02nite_080210 [Paractinoplanes toevensis]|uniref:Uncharacterized protein n=1 Tax=Paractinoplanes toevensis TaxID=571911 RepID=A0A919W9R7_9ACTN|nr:hypothetical protein Ato02nite_080210 [Actinoplanes toevensis]